MSWHLICFPSLPSHFQLDRLDPMQNQMCRVCEEPAAGFHFGAFTCEGCKSFFGRTCNNQSVIQECKNNYHCVVDKKNRTACKACRLRKCLMVGMSKSGSRYGRRSNWFKIHCLMQQNIGGGAPKASPPSSSTSSSSLSPNAPMNLWPSPPKTEQREQSPHPTHRVHHPIPEQAQIRLPQPPSPPRSPEAPTLVPRTSAITTSLSHSSPTLSTSHSPSSPFKNLLPSSPSSTASKPEIPSSPITPPVASLYGGFPSPLSMLGGAGAIHGFPGIPFHKQGLLSPLLAQSHLWQMAAASRHPLFSDMRPQLDLMAEHKALIERFQTAATAAAATAASETASEADHKSLSSPKSSTGEDPAEPQNCPMDLSSKLKSDDEDDDEEKRSSSGRASPISVAAGPILSHSAASLLKADLNRNLIAADARAKVLDLYNKSS